MKTSYVKSNDPENPKQELIITGLVEQFADISPGSVIHLTGNAKEPLKQTVTIVPRENNPFTITKVTAVKGENIAYQLIPRKPESEGYELVIENKKQEEGRFGDTIILETSSQVKPMIYIRVIGDIRGIPSESTQKP